MRKKPLISLISAVAEDRVIGKDNQLIWHLPADLRHFKQLTLDKPIIMGRLTWESLPGLLPRRRHIVISRDLDYRAPGCEVVNSWPNALSLVKQEAEAMVIGGAEIYRLSLPDADRMYLTLIQARFSGDTHFPQWEPGDWREIKRQEHPADEANPYPYSFVTLERCSP